MLKNVQNPLWFRGHPDPPGPPPKKVGQHSAPPASPPSWLPPPPWSPATPSAAPAAAAALRAAPAPWHRGRAPRCTATALLWAKSPRSRKRMTWGGWLRAWGKHGEVDGKWWKNVAFTPSRISTRLDKNVCACMLVTGYWFKNKVYSIHIG